MLSYYIRGSFIFIQIQHVAGGIYSIVRSPQNVILLNHMTTWKRQSAVRTNTSFVIRNDRALKTPETRQGALDKGQSSIHKSAWPAHEAEPLHVQCSRCAGLTPGIAHLVISVAWTTFC